ncbi:G-protein coupled receptor GRL101-like [Tubulanus polymorphus]|uniref:G-protein coupled receptor GRL101-like n=1 Tax=Tubulanus polymorphus TaxID=672921 RepID=UPI003DA43665
MSVYLFLIAGTDHVYKGVYFLNSETWTRSSLCSVAGIVVTISCEGSLTFLFLLTRFRYSNIVDPFSDVNGWQYSFAIFAVLNAIILTLIMMSYAQMYKYVSGSRSGSGRADPTELVLARRSLVINLWLAVLFLPINSTLNPLLYTILTIDMKSIRARNKRSKPIK